MTTSTLRQLRADINSKLQAERKLRKQRLAACPSATRAAVQRSVNYITQRSSVVIKQQPCAVCSTHLSFSNLGTCTVTSLVFDTAGCMGERSLSRFRFSDAPSAPVFLDSCFPVDPFSRGASIDAEIFPPAETVLCRTGTTCASFGAGSDEGCCSSREAIKLASAAVGDGTIGDRMFWMLFLEDAAFDVEASDSDSIRRGAIRFLSFLLLSADWSSVAGWDLTTVGASFFFFGTSTVGRCGPVAVTITVAGFTACVEGLDVLSSSCVPHKMSKFVLRSCCSRHDQ